MKHHILNTLRKRLREIYCKNTADKYYFAVQRLYDGLEFNTAEDIPREETERCLERIRGRNDFSAAKRGLLVLEECYPGFKIPDTEFFTEHSPKRNFKKREFEPIRLDNVKRRINAIPDKRLKLAYRLMLATGARVSEVAELHPEDISITDQSVEINIRSGKGGKARNVSSLPDPYLARELNDLCDAAPPNTPVFYTDGHMKNEAASRGFECHDLRRVYAQDYRAFCKTTAPDTYTANGRTMEAMGHTDFRTTKKYLRRRIQRQK